GARTFECLVELGRCPPAAAAQDHVGRRRSSLLGGDATTRAAPADRRNHPFWEPLLPIFDEAEAPSPGDGLAAGAGIELAQERRDVAVDRPRRDVEALRDRLVRLPLGEQSQDFELPRRQTCRVVSRRRTWPARQSADAALAEATRHEPRGGGRTESLQV